MYSGMTVVDSNGVSGLFKCFADVLDDDLLVAKPVLLAATGGTGRHALVIDDQMRPLFAFMRAFTVPSSVYAAPEDWGPSELGQRIARTRGRATSTSSRATPAAPSTPRPMSTSTRH